MPMPMSLSELPLGAGVAVARIFEVTAGVLFVVAPNSTATLPWATAVSG